MNNHLRASLLVLLVLFVGWTITMADLPFSETDCALAFVSIVLMSLMPDRFIFAYIVFILLGYGGFLTFWTFTHYNASVSQMHYMYEHLLVTVFLLASWALMHLIKSLTRENELLKLQVAKLEKLDSQTNILTPQEFIYQAHYVLSDVNRKGEAWLVEIDLLPQPGTVKESLQESLEAIVLESVRLNFDLVTATDSKIYIILKNTDESGLQIVLNRIEHHCRQQLNFLNAPYTLHYEHFENGAQLKPIEEEMR